MMAALDVLQVSQVITIFQSSIKTMVKYEIRGDRRRYAE
jgi:hypothetical protein